MRILHIAFIIISLFAGVNLHAATESELKAAYVLKFTAFVTLPGEGAANTKPFTIGVVGSGEMFHCIERTAVGVRVKNSPVVVKRVHSRADAADCQIVYFENDTSLLAALRNEAILTVGDPETFCGSGGIIGFKKVGTKLRFAINKTAATKSRIGLSAQLIRLAIPE